MRSIPWHSLSALLQLCHGERLPTPSWSSEPTPSWSAGSTPSWSVVAMAPFGVMVLPKASRISAPSVVYTIPSRMVPLPSGWPPWHATCHVPAEGLASIREFPRVRSFMSHHTSGTNPKLMTPWRTTCRARTFSRGWSPWHGTCHVPAKGLAHS